MITAEQQWYHGAWGKLNLLVTLCIKVWHQKLMPPSHYCVFELDFNDVKIHDAIEKQCLSTNLTLKFDHLEPRMLVCWHAKSLWGIGNTAFIQHVFIQLSYRRIYKNATQISKQWLKITLLVDDDEFISDKRNTYTFASVNATPYYLPHIHNYMQIHRLLSDCV